MEVIFIAPGGLFWSSFSYNNFVLDNAFKKYGIGIFDEHSDDFFGLENIFSITGMRELAFSTFASAAISPLFVHSFIHIQQIGSWIGQNVGRRRRKIVFGLGGGGWMDGLANL